MVVALVCCIACSEGELQPLAAPVTCSQERAKLPATLDPRSVSWQLVVPPHGAPQRFDAVLDTCESWVSLAHDEAGSGANELLSTSDGAAWSRSAIAGVPGATYFDLARGDRHSIAVGRGAKGGASIAISTGGNSMRFREVFTAPDEPFEHVAFGAGTFVAQSRSGVAFSHDAEHWRWSAIPPRMEFFDVAFGNGRFVIAAAGPTISSTDGETWQVASESLLVQQVGFVGGKFYGFGASKGYESRDGLTFTPMERMIPDAKIGGVLVGLGDDVHGDWVHMTQVPNPPRLLVSEDDGITWFSQRLTVSSADVDCSIDPCVVVPQGILVARPKAGAVAAPSSELCDGTSDMRLMAYFGPGLVDVSSSFTSPYGKLFFAIDGRCRYYAQDNPAHAIVRGQLTPAQATELSADLSWQQLPAWGRYRPTVQCADAGGIVLATQQAAFSCGPTDERIGCGCGPAAPVGLPATMRNALRWHATLLQAGTPLDGPLSALAQRWVEPGRSWQAWPLARSIPSIPGFIVDSTGFATGQPGVRFEDPTEVAQLRKLRELQPEAASSAGFSVREGGGAYTIYLRDEIPEEDASAMRKLMQWVGLQLSAP